jgi:hypothetical protein
VPHATGGCVPNWNIASGLDTHLPSPQIEQPPAGVAGHEFLIGVGCGVGFNVVGFGVVGVGGVGAGVVGTAAELH